MSRIIGICIPFLNEERKSIILETAKQYGFEVNFYDHENVRQDEIDSCEVVFGMVKRKLINNAKKLKWLQASFAGVDKYVDIENLKNGNIILTNSSGAFGVTISEHMIAVLLMLMRRMPEYHEQQKEKEWKMVGDIKSIMNSVITVIGFGDIGENFAKRAKAMGATIHGVRRNADKKSEFADKMYSIDNLLEAIEGADVIALSLPDTDKTKHVINAEVIDKMKNDAILINVGRGTAIDEAALIEALKANKLGGVALDVFESEPLSQDSPLWSFKNTIITPHISGNTSLPLTCDMLVDIFCDNLAKYANNEKLNNLIDCRKGY
jgi:phosphoglycerate dehydrogenase-like enzyme